MRTEKIIRADGQWVKIRRDEDKSFDFYQGWEGETKYHYSITWPKSAISTWKEAETQAMKMIEDRK